jgi:hypothetical protein
MQNNTNIRFDKDKRTDDMHLAPDEARGLLMGFAA